MGIRKRARSSQQISKLRMINRQASSPKAAPSSTILAGEEEEGIEEGRQEGTTGAPSIQEVEVLEARKRMGGLEEAVDAQGFQI